MQYQQTPQGLNDMFSSNVANGGGSIAATPAMMGLWTQQQQADNTTQQDQARQLAFDTSNDPLKLQASGLANQTAEAHLPGIQAQSGMLQRQNTNEAATNDAKIADILGKYKSADVARHVEDTANFGTRLSQMGEEAFSNPVGAAQRVKQELSSMGHGDMWNPAWEASDPGMLAKQLQDYGSDIQSTSSKFKQALELANTKADAARDVAATNAKARTDVQTMKNELGKAVADARAKAGNNPKNLEALATQLESSALNETDDAKKATLLEHSLRIRKEAESLKAAGAQVAADVKPHLPAFGIQDNASARGKATPVPPGWKDNGDGTLTDLNDPTRVIKKK